MPSWIQRITPLVLSLMVAGTSYADNPSVNNNLMAPIKAKIKQVNDETSTKDEASRQRQLSIAQRTNDIFTLFASELAFGKGQTNIALATDLHILERTQDSALAERSMEMALAANQIALAGEIAEKWQIIDPKNSTEKQRLLWELALSKNDIPQILKYTESALASANENQLRRMFLMLSQFRLKNLNASDELNQPIHKIAVQHQDLVEAMIADAIYGATGDHKSQTMNALQRLSELDSDIFPATQLTLNLINIKQPQYLIEFYQQAGINKLSARWLTFYTEILIKNNKIQDAYLILQPLLDQSKNAELYMQAIYLGTSQQESSDTIISYVKKVIELGDQNQRSKAAMMAAMRYYDEHNYTEALTWINQVTDPYYNFDKAILMASIESDNKNWAQAKSWLSKAEKAQKQATFFDPSEIVRIRTFINSSSLTPQQYEIQLTKELAQAEKADASQREINIPPLLYLRGLLYADKLNQPEKGVKDLRRYVALRPNQADGLNALGYSLLSLPKSNWEEAYKLIEQAYELDSQSPAINDSLGWAYYLQGENNKALPLLEYAFKHQPEAEVAAHLGEVYWQLGLQDDARSIWTSGLATRQSDQTVLLQILHKHGIKPNSLLTNQKNISKAETDNQTLLDKIIFDYTHNVAENIFISDVNKLMVTGNTAQKNKAAMIAASWFNQYNNNKEVLKWISEISGDQYLADRAFLMGMIELRNHNYPAAQQWLQKMQQYKDSLMFFSKSDVFILSAGIDGKILSPEKYINKLNNLLIEAEKKGDEKAAATFFYYRAYTYINKLNQPKKAITDLRNYLKVQTKDAGTWNDLGYILLSLHKKHWPEAVSILEHAYKLDNQNNAIKDSLGWAYYLTGDAYKALPLLRSSYSNKSLSPTAAHLGEVLWQLGQKNEAKQIWAQGLTDTKSDSKELQNTLKKFAIKPDELKNLLDK